MTGEKEEETMDEQNAEIQLRIERMRNKKLEKLRRREVEAMRTFESCLHSLNKLDSMNIEQKLGIDTKKKYEAG